MGISSHNKDPNAWYGPDYNSNVCPAANVSRAAPLVNGPALVSGQLELTAIYIPGGTEIQGIQFLIGSTSSGSTTHSMAGIYSRARALLTGSVDNTTQVLTANTFRPYQIGGGSPWICPVSGLYYVGLFVVANPMPTLAGTTLFHVNQSTEPPIVCGTSDTGLTTALPDPAAAITPTTAFRACWLYGPAG